MSKTVYITSARQFDKLRSSSRIVVADFFADWCGPCKQIAPIYEQLSTQLSRPQVVTFTKVDVDSNQDIARQFGVTAMPTFVIWKNDSIVETIRGADPRKLTGAVKKLAAEADSDGSASAGGFGDASSSTWLGAALPKGYKDVTDQVDKRGLDLLNADSSKGDASTLFNPAAPSALSGKGKGKDAATATADAAVDWVESDTDEQLMLFVPFQATLKIHTLHITSLPSSAGSDAPMRPRTVRLYTNRAHVLGFDEAESMPPVQEVVLHEKDWDAATGTARLDLRFVKFQSVTSLVVFVFDGDGEADNVRIDRLRILGEAGDKRDQGKLEKISDGD